MYVSNLFYFEKKYFNDWHNKHVNYETRGQQCENKVDHNYDDNTVNKWKVKEEMVVKMIFLPYNFSNNGCSTVLLTIRL